MIDVEVLFGGGISPQCLRFARLAAVGDRRALDALLGDDPYGERDTLRPVVVNMMEVVLVALADRLLAERRDFGV